MQLGDFCYLGTQLSHIRKCIKTRYFELLTIKTQLFSCFDAFRCFAQKIGEGSGTPITRDFPKF